jgi:transketolase
MNFRQWGSLTPGHPESHLTPGVETTTGPLGQGLANAVGLAMAEAHLAARFNKPGHEVVNHYTYVLAGDGDMMEGVAAEACSLAGHLRLGKLIVFYDDNRITLSGTTSLSFTEDVGLRFGAYGWHVQRVSDGNDLDAVNAALAAARSVTDQPSLIITRTHIGAGAPHKQDTFEAHGSPLGEDELKAAKENLGWPVEPKFLIPPEAQAHFHQALERGQTGQAAWEKKMIAYAQAFPGLAAEFKRRLAGDLPASGLTGLPVFAADPKGLATRKASEGVMQALAAQLPELVGGSADLNTSTFTWLKEGGDFESPHAPADHVQGAVGGGWGYDGRNVHFGVREHAMGAIVNGLARHGGFIPYGSTFLVFSDYMRPAVRLSAIMQIGSIWVYTHDSVGVGEDGPTHQPVEHFAALRAIPGVLFIRPCDANETAWAWRVAIENRHRPTILALTRQNVPTLDRAAYASAEGLRQGAYILNPTPDQAKPDVILMASGSEVQLIVAAEKKLAQTGLKVRLVSMPSWELFAAQSPEYQESVLPSAVAARVAVEAGVSLGWHRWVGPAGAMVGLDHFGASAPAARLFQEFGLTPEAVVEKALHVIDQAKAVR